MNSTVESEKAALAGAASDTAVNFGVDRGLLGLATTGLDSRFSYVVKIGPAFRKGAKMAARQITCITELPSHHDSRHRIQEVGGTNGGTRWRDTEEAAIANVKRDPQSYYVSEQGKSVWVIVKQHDGRDYLKTQTDNFLPNNLLSLPEC